MYGMLVCGVGYAFMTTDRHDTPGTAASTTKSIKEVGMMTLIHCKKQTCRRDDSRLQKIVSAHTVSARQWAVTAALEPTQ